MVSGESDELDFGRGEFEVLIRYSNRDVQW